MSRAGVPRCFLRGHNRRGVGKGWIEGGYRYISVNGKKIMGRSVSMDDLADAEESF